MSGNYPEGSMKGSGIFSEEYKGTFFCPTCEDEYSLEGQTDDFGVEAYAECPDCGETLTKEISDERGVDEDAIYDDWRESQLDWDEE